MFDFNSVLVVGAHPDDIEYSCLGLLSMLKSQGSRVSCFLASLGSKNDATTGNVRLDETRNSLLPLGFQLIVNKTLDFDYTSTETHLRDILLELKVDCLLVHDPRDTHQEHRFIYDVAKSALRRLDCTVIRYKSVSSDIRFTANLYVDITSSFSEKINAISMHRSQAHKTYMQPHAIAAFHTLYDPGHLTPRMQEQYYLERLMLSV